MKYRLIIIAFFFLIKENSAQIYLNDPNWTQVKHDDFNSLNTADWYNLYPDGGSGWPVNNGLEYNSTSNLLFNHSPGYLTIKCEKLTTPIVFAPGPFSPYNYQSGVIWSKFYFKYGYWEIKARLPTSKGYWLGMYLFGCGPNSCVVPGNNDYWDEIDNLENSGDDSQYNDRMGINHHWRDTITCQLASISGGLLPSSTQTVPGNTTSDNKYGMLWEPGKMTWYFNDVPIKTIVDPDYTPAHAINTVINFCIDPYNQPDPNTSVFPAYYEIDYLNIYQLTPSTSNCSVPVTSCTFNPSTYISEVKKSVSIGGTGCTSSINTTNNIHFWATDFVLLDEGTTITSGASDSFSAYITNCPN